VSVSHVFGNETSATIDRDISLDRSPAALAYLSTLIFPLSL
jgi:hypothetical protein